MSVPRKTVCTGAISDSLTSGKAENIDFASLTELYRSKGSEAASASPPAVWGRTNEREKGHHVTAQSKSGLADATTGSFGADFQVSTGHALRADSSFLSDGIRHSPQTIMCTPSISSTRTVNNSSTIQQLEVSLEQIARKPPTPEGDSLTKRARLSPSADTELPVPHNTPVVHGSFRIIMNPNSSTLMDETPSPPVPLTERTTMAAYLPLFNATEVCGWDPIKTATPALEDALIHDTERAQDLNYHLSLTAMEIISITDPNMLAEIMQKRDECFKLIGDRGA